MGVAAAEPEVKLDRDVSLSTARSAPGSGRGDDISPVLARGEAIQDACFVAFGLQSPDEPRPDVGKALVVEIDRILRGQDDAETEGPSLFEQR